MPFMPTSMMGMSGSGLYGMNHMHQQQLLQLQQQQLMIQQQQQQLMQANLMGMVSRVSLSFTTIPNQ